MTITYGEGGIISVMGKSPSSELISVCYYSNHLSKVFVRGLKLAEDSLMLISLLAEIIGPDKTRAEVGIAQL